MTFSTNHPNGDGSITLTKTEVEAFKKGLSITKHSGDSKGVFKIVLKLVRPKIKNRKQET